MRAANRRPSRGLLAALLLIGALAGCGAPDAPPPGDPLPSWNDSESRRRIVAFVEAVSTPGSDDFVPEADRIATFDNDGCLWTEQPVYTQFLFAFDRIAELAPEHPEWRDEPAFRAVLDRDVEALAATGHEGILEVLAAAHVGMTTAEFDAIVRAWFAASEHPRLGRPYAGAVYQPMLELLAYLRSRGFRIYMVTGGGQDFVRPFAAEVYGIPPEQDVGSSIKTRYEVRDGKPVLVREPELFHFDDKEGKAIGIQRFIGRRPIAAFGNSDGDLQMLEWTTAGDGLRLGVIVHHTDGEREVAYDRDSKVGRLDKALDLAGPRGWVLVDMKEDWKTVFPTAE